MPNLRAPVLIFIPVVNSWMVPGEPKRGITLSRTDVRSTWCGTTLVVSHLKDGAVVFVIDRPDGSRNKSRSPVVGLPTLTRTWHDGMLVARGFRSDRESLAIEVLMGIAVISTMIRRSLADLTSDI